MSANLKVSQTLRLEQTKSKKVAHFDFECASKIETDEKLTMGIWLSLTVGMNEKATDNRVAGGFSPPAPTPPGMRVRTGRFDRITGP